jgi:hypothetical protein
MTLHMKDERFNASHGGSGWVATPCGNWIWRANDLFIDNGEKLGKSEISYDVDAEIWEYNCGDDADQDDDLYSS